MKTVIDLSEIIKETVDNAPYDSGVDEKIVMETIKQIYKAGYVIVPCMVPTEWWR